jgi:hypothetical protein
LNFLTRTIGTGHWMRWTFCFLPTINAWREYHYNAIREFCETRGFDPYSNDVARFLGSPLAEMEPHILTSKGPEFYDAAHGWLNCPLLADPPHHL